MHVRVRVFGKPDAIVVVDSKLTKIEQFRRIVKDKFNVEPKLQQLFYGGKLLENGYTFFDYSIKLNDVIQLMIKNQPDIIQNKVKSDEETPTKNNDLKDTLQTKHKAYTDADSTLYIPGDLVDIKDRGNGAWFEGKILQIVLDPNIIYDEQEGNLSTSFVNDNENDLENKPPSTDSDDDMKSKKKGIAKYFSKQIKGRRHKDKTDTAKISDENILYKVQLDIDKEDSDLFCKFKEIRPRARQELNIKGLKRGQTFMINHNTDDLLQKGYWYDFKLDEIKKLRTTYELIGTLYLGPDSVPQSDTRVRVHDKIFAIEEPVPITDRNKEHNNIIPEKRSQPLNCLKCRDDEDTPCKECGCYLCSGKESPEKTVLCDDCDNGYHMKCLSPPLTELPEEDWYCPSCKRDPNDVIAPGAAKQTKKSNASKTNRDWGRGMACAGKTKTCAMPANHFGPIPGIEVGMCWRFRIQLSESGVHRPPVSGIHGRDVEGAYSIVLSGGYEDDVDYGNDFTYTGSGGRDLSGNKRTAEQSCDQTLTRENKALARNCAVKEVNEKGADAGDAWRQGKPVRVVRSYKMLKHFPKYAPKEGIRYDGIYKVVKYYPEKGLSGYRVWKYLLRRDDPSLAPWEAGAKFFPIVYPDGYLEAEAEKKALKEKKGKGKVNKKRALRESNQTSSESETSPPLKKRKTGHEKKNENAKNTKNPKILNMVIKSPKSAKKGEIGLNPEEKAAIVADTLNHKLWDECLEVCEKKGKKEFIEHVTQVFLCIICQEVTVSPVTTPCLHNFCMACMKLAFKSTESQACPCCRQNLSKMELNTNEYLMKALRTVLPGYDAGKK